MNRLLFILMDVLHLDSLASLVLHGLLVGGYLFWLFFAGIRMALHKPLFYERWSTDKVSKYSKTHIKSDFVILQDKDGSDWQAMPVAIQIAPRAC